MITLQKELTGRILDIGGGGEAVIGRLYGSQVTAIDNCQEELDEVPEVCRKLWMDATALEFADAEFDHVTAFYTLMYMTGEEQRRAVQEAARVLKPGGGLHIWDCDIVSAYPEPFSVDLQIQLPETRISTTYGVGKLDGQNMESIGKMCVEAGLSCESRHRAGEGFRLRFKKGE